MPKGSYKRKKRGTYKKKGRAKAKHRQQLLSVSTVQNIARKICSRSNEQKYFMVNNKAVTGAAGSYWIQNHIHGPHSMHVNTCILQSSTLSQGTTSSEYVGDSIFLEGFQFRLEISPPLYLQSWCDVHYMVVRFKTSATGTGDPAINSENTARSFFDIQKVVNLEYSKQKLSIVHSGVCKFRDIITATKVYRKYADTTNDPVTTHDFPVTYDYRHKVQPKLVSIYVPIKKKYHITIPGAANTAIYKYYFISYARAQFQGRDTHNSMWNGTLFDSDTTPPDPVGEWVATNPGSDNFAPFIRGTYCIWYKDP